MGLFVFLWLVARIIIYTVCVVLCVINPSVVAILATTCGVIEVFFYICKLCHEGTVL